MNGATSAADAPPLSTPAPVSASETSQVPASTTNGSAANIGSLKKRKMEILKPIITTEE
ncbi:hypothetical protein SEPCBS57363_000679 [Sporothrix epigloea]|uniref:Uncharacterized protein n=1 Tax=Sporothrix epigloea TaxID=1892477 RepID=A0ABP0D719_9PEZI